MTETHVKLEEITAFFLITYFNYHRVSFASCVTYSVERIFSDI